MARLKVQYDEEILPKMGKKFGIKNAMSTPRIQKIVVNRGVGKALENKKRLQAATDELALITGQRPVVTKAKKSVANFHLRDGNEIGCKVTLRGNRMYEFLDRLVTVAMPRIRDFRGVKPSFDGRGNFAMGLKEHIVFPEIDFDKVDEVWGMDIIITTTASTDAEAKALLKAFNMPFNA